MFSQFVCVRLIVLHVFVLIRFIYSLEPTTFYARSLRGQFDRPEPSEETRCPGERPMQAKGGSEQMILALYNSRPQPSSCLLRCAPLDSTQVAARRLRGLPRELRDAHARPIDRAPGTRAGGKDNPGAGRYRCDQRRHPCRFWGHCYGGGSLGCRRRSGPRAPCSPLCQPRRGSSPRGRIERGMARQRWRGRPLSAGPSVKGDAP